MRERHALTHQPQVVACVSIGHSQPMHGDASDYQARTERS